MSKSTAFVICVVCLMGIFFCSILTAASLEDVPISGVITALVAVTTGYIGLQVTNNGVIGKYYRPELDKRGKDDDQQEPPLPAYTYGRFTVEPPEEGTGAPDAVTVTNASKSGAKKSKSRSV